MNKTKTEQVGFRDDFPDDILKIVGQITLSLGQIEYLLKLTIKRLLRKPFDEGMGVAESIWPIRNLSRQAEHLFAVRVMDQTTEAEFRVLLDRVEALSEPRHRVIHALWAIPEGGGFLRIRKGVNYGVNLQDLRRLRREIRGVVHDLEKFTRDHPRLIGRGLGGV